MRKADVLALEVRLAEAKERELRARNARDLALAALNTLLGLTPAESIELSGDEWRPRELPGTYELAVREALNRRPELLAARETVRRADHAASAEKTTFLPRVDLVGRTWLDDPDLQYNRKDTNWAVGVNLGWDLFLGGSRFARVARASARVDELRALDRKAALDVELDVRNAYLRVGEARARLDVAEKSVRQAEDSLDQTSKLYRGGAATITRYLETELALTNARVRLTRARYDLKRASADLARAIGWCVECARKEGTE
jgi:outer membrane protein TolC